MTRITQLPLTGSRFPLYLLFVDIIKLANVLVLIFNTRVRF